MRPEPRGIRTSGACCSKATQQCLARLCTTGRLLYGPRQFAGRRDDTRLRRNAHENNIWTAGRGGSRADSGDRLCGRAEQALGQDRDRRRGLSLLPADRAGEAPRRVRQGRRRRRADRFQGRLAGAPGGARRLGRRRLGLLRPLRQSRRQGPVAAGVRRLQPLPRTGARRLAGRRQGHQVDQGSGGQERRRLGAGLLDRLLPEVPAREERRGRQLGRNRGRRPRRDRGRRHGARQGARGRDARSGGDAAAEQVQGSQDPERHAHPEGYARRVRRRISGRLALHPRRLDRQERGHRHSGSRPRSSRRCSGSTRTRRKRSWRRCRPSWSGPTRRSISRR